MTQAATMVLHPICSFCGKHRDDAAVRVLVATSNVAICGQCIIQAMEAVVSTYKKGKVKLK